MNKEFLTRILGKNFEKRAYRDYVVQVVDGDTAQTQKIPFRATEVNYEFFLLFYRADFLASNFQCLKY